MKKFTCRRGCLFLLMIIPVSFFLCYGGMWIFARYGGEWATDRDLPIPPNSQLIITTYTDGFYMEKERLYIHTDNPEMLREWFKDAGVSMTPIALDSEGKSFIEYVNGYGTPAYYGGMSNLSELHNTSARYTGWWDDAMPTCYGVLVYTPPSAALEDFPDTQIPDGFSTFMIRTCWANVES